VGGPQVVLHAATQDLEIVQRLAGTLPPEIFDTQVAAAFLGLGDSIGYSKLIERVVGESPARSEAYTDWSIRPLTPEQIGYALDDVRWLLECADRLSERLRQRGRMEWVRQELVLLLESINHSPEPLEQWQRVSGARGLSGRALAVLREVAAWREEEAIRRDVPRQRVVADRVLVEIARRSPRSPDQVRKLRGLHPREAERSATAIIDAVQRGRAADESTWPSFPRTPAPADDAAVDAASSLLDAAMRAIAQDLELSSRLLGTRADLDRLIRLELAGMLDDGSTDSIPFLSGWRREVAGETLLGLLRGERGLRVLRHDRSLSIQID